MEVEDQTAEARQRHATITGQVLFTVLKHAAEKHANLMYLFHRFDKDDSGVCLLCMPQARLGQAPVQRPQPI